MAKTKTSKPSKSSKSKAPAARALDPDAPQA